MSRTVLRGGLVYDGTESLLAEADVVIEAGRIVDVGIGLDDELGTLSPGKRADLVVLSGDPLDAIDLKARVTGVFKDGIRAR